MCYSLNQLVIKSLNNTSNNTPSLNSFLFYFNFFDLLINIEKIRKILTRLFLTNGEIAPLEF